MKRLWRWKCMALGFIIAVYTGTGCTISKNQNFPPDKQEILPISSEFQQTEQPNQSFTPPVYSSSNSKLSSKLPEQSSVSSVSSSFETNSSFIPEPNMTVYLTFDDGPSEITPKILTILKEHDVKATFFVVHKNSSTLENYMKQAYQEGHEIAVHSYTHNYKQIYQSEESFLEDFEKTRQWIQTVTGAPKPTLQYRFPGGSSISAKFADKTVLNRILYRMRELHAIHHDWNVSSGDAAKTKPTKKQLLHNIMENALKYKEPVILMHDSSKNSSTCESLPEIIESLRKEGYRFDTISNIKQPVQHKIYSESGIPANSERYLHRKKAPKFFSHSSTVAARKNTVSEQNDTKRKGFS